MANQTLVQQARQNLAAAEAAKPQAVAREAAAAAAAEKARAEYQQAFSATVAAQTALGNAPVQTKELQDAVTKLTLEERTKSAQYSAAIAELDSATLNLEQINRQITQANKDLASAELASPDGQGTIPPSVPTPISDQVPLIQTLNPQPTEAVTAPVAAAQITTTNTVITNFDTAGIDLGDQIPTVQPIIVTGDRGDPIVVNPPPIVEPQKTGDAYPNEFQGVDEAVAQQQRIAINTSGLPVLAEDGTVAQGVAINPETGQTYYTVPTGSSVGLQGNRTNAQAQSTAQDQANFALTQDWRVRLSLAPNSGYLYNALNVQGILQPLIQTNGVVFPYTPSIQIQYNAHYDSYDLTHSNYKIQQYKNSSVDNIMISCDFTAQDTAEANYLLAVIHFFRSVTKMFYGQDSIPKIGTPPPLCFLTGLGSFQFDNHPLAITNFAYSLPTDVDYIRASASATTAAGVNKSPAQEPNNTNAISNSRLSGSSIPITTGGVTPATVFGQQTLIQTPSASSRTPTYVPTKMNLSISAVPIVTRNDVSNRFSLRDYATGKLLQGSKNATVGIW